MREGALVLAGRLEKLTPVFQPEGSGEYWGTLYAYSLLSDSIFGVYTVTGKITKSDAEEAFGVSVQRGQILLGWMLGGQRWQGTLHESLHSGRA